MDEIWNKVKRLFHVTICTDRSLVETWCLRIRINSKLELYAFPRPPFIGWYLEPKETRV